MTQTAFLAAVYVIRAIRGDTKESRRSKYHDRPALFVSLWLRSENQLEGKLDDTIVARLQSAVSADIARDLPEV
jgi:hypothetical protein